MLDYLHIKEFAKAHNLSVTDLLALSPKNDPFYARRQSGVTQSGLRASGNAPATTGRARICVRCITGHCPIPKKNSPGCRTASLTRTLKSVGAS